MSPSDFVYKAIYRECMAKKIYERFAKEAAVSGVEDFKRGKFKTAQKLIDQKIAEAKKRKK